MAAHGIPYVAQASVTFDAVDLARKAEKPLM